MTLYYPDRSFIRGMSMEQLLADCTGEDRPVAYLRNNERFDVLLQAAEGFNLGLFDEQLHKDIVATYYSQMLYPGLFRGHPSVQQVDNIETAFIWKIVEDYRRIANNRNCENVMDLEQLLQQTTPHRIG